MGTNARYLQPYTDLILKCVGRVACEHVNIFAHTLEPQDVTDRWVKVGEYNMYCVGEMNPGQEYAVRIKTATAVTFSVDYTVGDIRYSFDICSLTILDATRKLWNVSQFIMDWERAIEPASNLLAIVETTLERINPYINMYAFDHLYDGLKSLETRLRDGWDGSIRH